MAITYLPRYAILILGAFHFWDKDSKQRLQAFKNANLPITCGAFNGDSSIFAYAVCYDWSRGAQAYKPDQMKTHILLHGVSEKEIKPRAGGNRF